MTILFHALLSLLLWAVSGLLFTSVDVYGFGTDVQEGKLKLVVYRIIQITLQFSIYAILIWLHEYGALAGFMFAHWAMGYDWAYYIFRKENYLGYNITWFAMSLPSLIFKYYLKRPFMGTDAAWIGPVALIVGAVIALLDKPVTSIIDSIIAHLF